MNHKIEQFRCLLKTEWRRIGNEARAVRARRDKMKRINESPTHRRTAQYFIFHRVGIWLAWKNPWFKRWANWDRNYSRVMWRHDRIPEIPASVSQLPWFMLEFSFSTMAYPHLSCFRPQRSLSAPQLWAENLVETVRVNCSRLQSVQFQQFTLTF